MICSAASSCRESAENALHKSIVILSEASASRSGALAKSKDHVIACSGGSAERNSYDAARRKVENPHRLRPASRYGVSSLGIAHRFPRQRLRFDSTERFPDGANPLHQICTTLRLLPQCTSQDYPRFLLHGSSVHRRADLQFAFGTFFQISDGDACHMQSMIACDATRPFRTGAAV